MYEFMNKKFKIVITSIALCAGLVFTGTNTYATTGKAINDTTRIRKEASTNSDVVEIISKNTKVEIISEDGDWYKIKFKSSSEGTIVGYVRSDLLKVEEETKTEESKQEQTKNEDTKNEETSNQTSKEQFSEEDVKEESVLKLKDNTELQLLPLVYSSKTGSISKDTEVTILEKVGNWCHIEAEEQDGWIMTSKIVEIQNTDQENKVEEKKQEEKQEEKKEEKKEETKQEVTQTKQYVSTTTLNLREKTESSAKILKQLNQNDEVTVVEKVDGTWYKVKVNGVTGYVASQYLSTKKQGTTSRGSQETRTAEEKKEEKKEENTTATTTSESTTSKNDNTSKKTESSSTKKDSSNKNSSSSSSESKTKSDSKKTSSSKKSSGTTGSDVIAYAKRFLGNPYVYGGTSLTKGCDCSGFVMSVYAHFGYSLPHSSASQRSVGKKVSKSNLQAGDIVCFSGHVGMYIGGGKFIHAANSRKGIIISSLSESYYSRKYITARRVIN